MSERHSEPPPRVIGRYALYGELAAGGMATVHLGRLLGPVGFSRTVVVKRLHPHFAKDRDFVSMFVDEARLCARIRHPNVVPTVDVVAGGGQLLLVMEYVQGESLSRLARLVRTANAKIPPGIIVEIIAGILHGLHAAHEAKDERGAPLGIVHRDVSPQNALVGTDGVPRVIDFGIAKAKGRIHTTQDGRVKGKLAYMSPEQLRGESVDRRTDIYAASIMLWELLAGSRLFEADNEGAIIEKALFAEVPKPSKVVPSLGEAFDAVTMRGLSRDPSKRFATAREMALALEACITPATSAEVGTWVESLAHDTLAERAARVAEIESSCSVESQRVNDVITELTSDPEITKDGEDAGPKSVLPTKVEGRSNPPRPTASKTPPPRWSGPPVAGGELASQAHAPVSRTQGDLSIERASRKWLGLAIVGLAAAVAFLLVRPSAETKGSAESVAPIPPPTEVTPGGALPGVVTTDSLDAASSDAGRVVDAAVTVDAASARADAGRRASGVAPPHAPDCTDPFTRDELGRKIYKIECLK